jgi:hypothetical protein
MDLGTERKRLTERFFRDEDVLFYAATHICA